MIFPVRLERVVHLLVVSGGELVGVVSPSDISRTVQRAALRPQRQPAIKPM